MSEFSPTAIVLGRGIELEDGQAYLSPGSEQRADGMAQHFAEHREEYTDGGLIVVSGGHHRLATDEFDRSEADLMADRLVQQGVSHNLIEKETTSTSTLGNFVNSVGYFADRQITEANPLTVVTHRYHWPRARHLGHKTLDVPMQPFFAQGGTRYEAVQDKAMNAIWHAALLGVQPGDMERLTQREKSVNDFFALRFGTLLRRVVTQ